ncbi:MAG: hypothetical protein CMN91_10330 [Synechococcus sp. ARS1019]|nr:hypothetical protein [Synechococcus sp. ARS1019]
MRLWHSQCLPPYQNETQSTHASSGLGEGRFFLATHLLCSTASALPGEPATRAGLELRLQ